MYPVNKTVAEGLSPLKESIHTVKDIKIISWSIFWLSWNRKNYSLNASFAFRESFRPFLL